MDSSKKSENIEGKYTVKEVFDSCYWEVGDDGENDGYLHIVSTINGGELRINLASLKDIKR